MKNLLNLNNSDAKKYFMFNDSYCNIKLPPYFNFTKVLEFSSQKLNEKGIEIYSQNNVLSKLDNVNYKFLSNKNGKYSWRPFQIIHPMIYIDLVNLITKEKYWEEIKKCFSKFKKNKDIMCCSDFYIQDKKSISGTNIYNWWKNFEQKSIKLSLEYSMIGKTDISNCYESIYTHSIAWALHTKEIAKQNIGKPLLGNKIDKKIQQMQYNQTNGIPQGSTLMDFIAEIVLGYADELLTEKIKSEKIDEYKILRFRDDYRIFANNKETIENILKLLSEVLSELNMKLNQEKTLISDDIIFSSIKPDKLYWNEKKQIFNKMSIQEKLLEIKLLSSAFPNSGSLKKVLHNLYKTEILHLKKEPTDNSQLIAILSEIMLNNPNVYPEISAILSVLLSINSCDSNTIISNIIKKTEKIPNTDYFEIWLHRAVFKVNEKIKINFNTPLVKKIDDRTIKLWNSNWLNFDFKEDIINDEILQKIPTTINIKEIDVFAKY